VNGSAVLGTDIWINSTNTCSLLNFTRHFVIGPQRLKVILGAVVLEEDHTGDYFILIYFNGYHLHID
jgi:hypothetical protein